MKKATILIMALLLLLTFTACGETAKVPKDTGQKAEEQVVKPQEEQATKPKEEATGGQVQSTEKAGAAVTPKSGGQGKKDGAAPSPGKETGVIAKSDNAVSSQEKEEILKELDQELDGLFKNIDDIGKIDDSELEF